MGTPFPHLFFSTALLGWTVLGLKRFVFGFFRRVRIFSDSIQIEHKKEILRTRFLTNQVSRMVYMFHLRPFCAVNHVATCAIASCIIDCVDQEACPRRTNGFGRGRRHATVLFSIWWGHKVPCASPLFRKRQRALPPLLPRASAKATPRRIRRQATSTSSSMTPSPTPPCARHVSRRWWRRSRRKNRRFVTCVPSRPSSADLSLLGIFPS